MGNGHGLGKRYHGDHEYNFPNLSIHINKIGYNPSLIKDIFSWVKQTLKKIKK
jgi:hypothetical protein